MKKTTVLLIALLTFFVGLAGGAILGFMLSPAKSGIELNVNNSGNNCSAFCSTKGKGGRKKTKSDENSRERPLLTDGNNKKISEERKAEKKWIGRK